MSDQITPEKIYSLSSNRQINDLLNDVVTRLKDYTESQVQHLNQLAKIGVALSGTRNLDQLLEMIVDEARAFTFADGGTLYLVTADGAALRIAIAQNETLNMRMGGVTGAPITWPPVCLKIDGQPNNKNVCAYVANSGNIADIPDVYEAPGFNFENTRKIDAQNKYRSKSMLVIPLRDHENEIIGVLQLINAREPETGEVIPFAPEYRELTSALASQAAVAITNARLIRDLSNLFDSFIKTIASAIDEKSPYTGGHIERVANLTMDIAKRMNEVKEGSFADTFFNEDQLWELRLAAWLHDTGKITTPEYVVDKRAKLQTIFDRMELVRMRFEVAKAQVGSDGQVQNSSELNEQIKRLDEEFQFVRGCNVTQEWVPPATLDRLRAIAGETIKTANGDEYLLNDNELTNLLIQKGNLTDAERQLINNHALVTIKMLEKLPFPKKIKNVPYIAGAHHEKLNGKGYPLGLKGDQIVLQARIMTLSDIFEALTAKDRPYNDKKEPRKLSEALKIINFMVKDGELDADVVQFFIDQKLHIDYAHHFLTPEQLDIE
ncbi:MAG: GAF domain-containing protein [Calditrichaeota bacterium]|nr:GAF domain-containing protein [Calditrichota bacterium]